ncbi:phage portal protein [Pseudomonas aeruginosa]|uniref:phage portal protein n=1 Tax=Pseudomonas aeruginosa TaxID=287 RepID=UPI000E32180B|nr:phage portal protein [Pseudomonas aeruginosa]NPZ19522.1 phage portal protein [Pseudomonas aeruginosa]
MKFTERLRLAFGRAAPPAPAVDRVEPQVIEQRSGRRAFTAASRTRLTSSWDLRSTQGDANQEIYRDHTTLRARAREQSINSPYAKRFYRLLKQNVIGPHGIALQSKAVTARGETDRKTRRLIEKEWRKFCRLGNCDVTGTYHFTTFMNLWAETLARDGEVMVRLVRNWSNRWGFALQILEIDRLDLDLNTELDNGNIVRMGVERDGWERPVAYWLLRSHPGDIYHRNEERYERVLAADLIHTFEPWRPHQTRGFTWTHASAAELHHLDEYRTAELVKAEMSAKITGNYEQDPEWLDPPEEGEDDGAIVEEIEAGTARLLPFGVTFKPLQSSSPSQFAPFTKQGLRGIAAGLGPSYNRLGNDLENVSFSSLRSGELDERDFYKVVQQFVINSFLVRVGETWLAHSILSGALPLPPRNFERYADLAWIPRGWDWVDPLKDSKAATESIGNRTKSRGYYVRQAGLDPDEHWDELEREEADLRRRGLLPTTPEKREPANAEEQALLEED